MTVVNLRALRNEADHLPSSLEEAAAIRAALLDAGQPPQVADGIVGWLIAKATGQPDLTAATTRSRYRRVLATLPPTVGNNATGRLLRRAA